jgi:hypothetical protein
MVLPGTPKVKNWSKKVFTRRMFAVAALTVILPAMALAHGPTRQKVTVTMEIAVPPDKVWSAIGNFQDMSWHPAVERTEGQNGNLIDATRRLTLKGGGTIDEILYNYDATAMTYSYRITAVDVKVLPVTNYSSHLTVKPAASGGSIVEWRGAFYRGDPNNDPPPELNDEAAVKAVTAVYRMGLEALKAKIEGGS